MKHKLKLFNIGYSTYFHHHYGVIVRRNRLDLITLYASTALVLAGGFFIISQLVVPAINRQISNLQNQKPSMVESTPLFEPNANDSSLPEIRQDNEVLTALITEKIAGFPKGQTWAVFAYDLQDGRTVKVGTDKVFESASLYKLFLLEALENKLPFDKWQRTKLPDRTTVQDCVKAMLQSSDSACAEDLGQYVGWESIDELNQKNGFSSSKVSANNGRKTTAADSGELMVRLKKGQILSDKARRFVFDALYQQTNTKGITLGCNGCRPADKIGESSTVVHDAGVVTHGGRSYVLVILSQGGNFDQIAELTRIIDTEDN